MLARFLASLAVFTCAAAAATYHVAPAGADSNPGTETQPWKTIQKAADALKPGDTALVHAGTYDKVTLHVSGSATGGYVKIANFPGDRPVIDGTNATPPDDDTGLILLTNRSYVIIEGFELRNYRTADVDLVPAGIFLRGACQHVQIRGCNIHDIANTGGDTDNAGNAFGIAVYGSAQTPAADIVIDQNEIHHLQTGASESVTINGNVIDAVITANKVHDNNNIGIDFIGFEGTCRSPGLDFPRRGVCRGNTVWNITSQGNQAYADGDYSADGIYCDGSFGTIVEGNTVHNCDIGVELASEHAGRVTRGVSLRNNVIYSNRQAGLMLGGYAQRGTGGTTGCRITNNTFYQNDTLQWENGEVQLRWRSAGNVFRNNVFYTGPGRSAVTVPVPAGQNVGNSFEYNLYWAPGGAAQVLWKWNNVAVKDFATWQRVSRQDLHSLNADPKLVSTGNAPDLHLQAGSPAINAGVPNFPVAAGELDIDGAARVTSGRIDLGADEQP